MKQRLPLNGMYPRVDTSDRISCPETRDTDGIKRVAQLCPNVDFYLVTCLPVTYRHREQRRCTATRIRPAFKPCIKLRRLYDGRSRLFFVTVVQALGVVPLS